MSGASVFLARQPIFTRQLDVFGYQLLSRTMAVDGAAKAFSDEASKEVIGACLIDFHFDSLVRGGKAFIKATGSLFKEDVLAILPKEKTVIELPRTVALTPGTLAAIEALKRRGYTIALDDLSPGREREPLVALADIIKVDFVQTRGDDRRELFEQHATNGKIMLADRLETHEDLTEALGAGYSLLQGFFFCKPEVVERKGLPRCKLNYLRFLANLSEPTLDLESLERVIKGETSLALRLLRYLNSSAFGTKVEMSSIKQAITHLGERPLKRWGSLVAMVGLGDDKPDELIVTSLTRARFCEFLGQELETGPEDDPLFLVGLFSTLDAMLDCTMKEALDQIAITPEIRGAILGDTSRWAKVLELAIAFEQADWPEIGPLASSLGVEVSKLSPLYWASLYWVDQIFDGGLLAAA